MLLCTDLSFAHQGRVGLSSLNISVPPGHLLALFGHNGSGKSTLLKMLGGSLPVQKGEALFNGRSIIGQRRYLRRDFRKHVGVLFQNSSSDDKLSVIDNLIFSARLYGLSNKHATNKSHEAIEHASLTERASDPVKKLSQGMRRRLELYRCFMHEPKLLLLDEPTAGLDVAHIKKFMSFLKQYKDEHQASIIMASHHADELIFADEIVMMNEGRMLARGTPSDMLLRLNYLRTSFRLSYEDRAKLDELQLFDRANNPDNSHSAKLNLSDLQHLLQSSLVREGCFKSLSIEKPSLADVYHDLVKEAHHDQ